MLRSTYPPAVFIELGNLKNPNDQKRILLESNRQALAQWIFEGLTR
jgi:N-acetylmuramoyl-L-alanine amidase